MKFTQMVDTIQKRKNAYTSMIANHVMIDEKIFERFWMLDVKYEGFSWAGMHNNGTAEAFHSARKVQILLI